MKSTWFDWAIGLDGLPFNISIKSEGRQQWPPDNQIHSSAKGSLKFLWEQKGPEHEEKIAARRRSSL